MALVGVDKIAQVFGLTPRRVQQLAKEMPQDARPGHGKYDLGLSMQWYIRYLQKKLDDKGLNIAPTENTLMAERQRLTKYQADMAKLEYQKALGELVPISLFQDAMAKVVMAARQQMLALPARVAPQLEGENRMVIKTKLQEEVRLALGSLSETQIPLEFMDDHADGNRELPQSN